MRQLVAVCGLPGSGKTLVAGALTTALRAAEVACDLVAPLHANSELIRRVSRLPTPGSAPWDARERWMTDYLTLRLLEVADQEILPAVGAGRWVVTDRWLADQEVNQSFFGVEVAEEQRPALSRLPVPELTVVLDVPVDVALRRNEDRGAGPFAVRRDFLEYAAAAYRRLVERDETMVLADGQLPPDSTADLIMRRLRPAL